MSSLRDATPLSKSRRSTMSHSVLSRKTSILLIFTLFTKKGNVLELWNRLQQLREKLPLQVQRSNPYLVTKRLRPHRRCKSCQRRTFLNAFRPLIVRVSTLASSLSEVLHSKMISCSHWITECTLFLMHGSRAFTTFQRDLHFPTENSLQRMSWPRSFHLSPTLMWRAWSRRLPLEFSMLICLLVKWDFSVRIVSSGSLSTSLLLA
mmetsp:Transcript_11209/g.41967  ORF Transcript_11209/g.41967 Transcript_11209/m.41967 type:complete len:206 (+) Transcript_11209:574-1191(+)